jgi:hypothetical protein
MGKKTSSPTLTLIVRTRIHLLLSGASRGMTVGFEFIRRIVMSTVRIETLTSLIERKRMNDHSNPSKGTHEFEHVPVKDIIVGKALPMEKISK